MSTIIHHHHTVFPNADAAAEVAAKNAAGDDDGWSYRVKVDPKGSGRAVIEIYDEDNFFVGNL